MGAGEGKEGCVSDVCPGPEPEGGGLGGRRSLVPVKNMTNLKTNRLWTKTVTRCHDHTGRVLHICRGNVLLGGSRHTWHNVAFGTSARTSPRCAGQAQCRLAQNVWRGP